MDWFLYDIGLRHERVNEKHTLIQECFKIAPEIENLP